MYVILLGLPGAGKGTQAAYLGQKTGLAHITTGELFRDNIRRATDLGLRAKPYYEAGQLVPDELTIGMLLERIAQPDYSQGCLFDGFPRTIVQATALDEALAARSQSIDKVFYIKVPQEELVNRLAGRWNCPNCGALYHEKNAPPQQPRLCDRCGGHLYQREDDTPEVVRQRLQVNLSQLTQLLDYYQRQGKLVEIDGHKQVDSVSQELLRALKGAAI